MLDRLQPLFREVFDQDDLVITDKTTASDISNWDSFNHINLVMRIEEEFGISFSTQEIGGLGTVKNIMDAITARRK